MKRGLRRRIPPGLLFYLCIIFMVVKYTQRETHRLHHLWRTFLGHRVYSRCHPTVPANLPPSQTGTRPPLNTDPLPQPAPPPHPLCMSPTPLGTPYEWDLTAFAPLCLAHLSIRSSRFIQLAAGVQMSLLLRAVARRDRVVSHHSPIGRTRGLL